MAAFCVYYWQLPIVAAQISFLLHYCRLACASSRRFRLFHANAKQAELKPTLTRLALYLSNATASEMITMTARKKPLTRRRSLLAVELLESRDLLAATSFAPGSLAVERLGSGTALSTSATPIFVDDYLTTLNQGQVTPAFTVALPTSSVAGGNQAVTDSGTTSTEGLMGASVDGHLLTVVGYDNPVSGGQSGNDSGTTVPRVVATVNNLGAVNSTTEITNAYSAQNIRTATTLDDQGFWTGGAGGGNGIQYVKLGATTSTTVAAVTFTTVKSLVVYNNQLYTDAATVGSTAATTLAGVGTVGTGVPDTTLLTADSQLPGFPIANDSAGNPPSPYQFSFENSTTLYVGDNRSDGFGGIQKWTLSNGSWSLAYSSQITEAGVTDGLWGVVYYGLNGSNQPVLYGTTTETSGNYIVQITDTGIGFTFANVAQAKTNEGFRGIQLAPTGPSTTTAPLSTTVLMQSSQANPAVAGTPITFSGTVLPGPAPPPRQPAQSPFTPPATPTPAMVVWSPSRA